MLYLNKYVTEDMEDIIVRDYIPFDKLFHKTVLITGANGMLAYYFTCVLMHLNKTKNAGIKVVALVRSYNKAKEKFKGFLDDVNFVLINQDVCEPIGFDGKVDYILHAAGSASPKFIKSDPVGIINANTKGTESVLEFARKKGVTNILYTSTREVYGEICGKEWIEETDMGTTDTLEARSCYPESKRMAEQIFKSYSIQYNVPFTLVRIAHSYGPGMDINNDGRVMSDFISDTVNNRNIVLKSDGTAVRAFCYVADAVSAMFAVMLKGENGNAYNISNEEEPIMIRDAAKMLAELFPEKNISVMFEKSADTSGYCNYARVGLSTKKLRELGWTPKVTLKDGLFRTVSSF